MRLGELPERAPTSRRLLRHHEEQGLLFSERSPNDHRCDDKRCLDRVPWIRGLLGGRLHALAAGGLRRPPPDH
jgi:DNA-binding transcriptional MerR regulator